MQLHTSQFRKLVSEKIYHCTPVNECFVVIDKTFDPANLREKMQLQTSQQFGKNGNCTPVNTLLLTATKEIPLIFLRNFCNCRQVYSFIKIAIAGQSMGNLPSEKNATADQYMIIRSRPFLKAPLIVAATERCSSLILPLSIVSLQFSCPLLHCSSLTVSLFVFGSGFLYAYQCDCKEMVCVEEARVGEVKAAAEDGELPACDRNQSADGRACFLCLSPP